MPSPNSPSARGWWHEHGEPRALTGLAMLAISLPPLMILELLDQAQAGRIAVLLAWAAGCLLLARLPALLRQEQRRPTFTAIIGLGALIATLGLGVLPAPATAQSGLSFKAAPRISRDGFTRVLQAGGSPAAGQGGELYDIIASYGLDPAVALAFFQHESQFCTTGRCARDDLRNWGMQRRHIRASRNAGSVDGFARYGSWPDSVRDWSELMLGYINRGLDTVEKAVPVYAPRADRNVPEAYINAIRRLVASWSGRALGPAVQLHTYSGPLDVALISETFLASEIEFRPTWAFHTYMLQEARAGRPLGAPLEDSLIVTVNGQRFAMQVFALDTLYTPIAPDENNTNWGDVRRLSELLRQGAPAPTASPTAAPVVPLVAPEGG